MEPITLCGVVILAVGLWEEFESIILRVAGAIARSSTMTAIKSPPARQRPLYVNYLNS